MDGLTAFLPSQPVIVGIFDAGSFPNGVDGAYGAVGQASVGVVPLIVLDDDKTALELPQAEYGQALYLAQLAVVHGPVAYLLVAVAAAAGR